MDYKLKRGDNLFIDFKSETLSQGYALCTYTGKRKGKHYFRSNTYGWKYIVDLQANTVICEDSPEKVYQIDHTSGWTAHLPQ